MKYMILIYASQQDYDAMAGKARAGPAGRRRTSRRMGTFMESFNQDLAESGELVDTRGLTAPVHARRIRLQHGRAGGDGRAVRRNHGGAGRLLDRGV